MRLSVSAPWGRLRRGKARHALRLAAFAGIVVPRGSSWATLAAVDNTVPFTGLDALHLAIRSSLLKLLPTTIPIPLRSLRVCQLNLE
jgi:hypothetical protein